MDCCLACRTNTNSVQVRDVASSRVGFVDTPFRPDTFVVEARKPVGKGSLAKTDTCMQELAIDEPTLR